MSTSSCHYKYAITFKRFCHCLTNN
uniref:Uncharacterized protein n=1 Tax=Rhizophora mucronata TaxID=61149 RepID=A0A2P2Q4V1_RHIMU